MDKSPILLENIVAHILATIIVIGFFTIILTALLGFVDIKDPAITAFVGTALGYAGAKVDPVISRYFLSRKETGSNVDKDMIDE